MIESKNEMLQQNQWYEKKKPFKTFFYVVYLCGDRIQFIFSQGFIMPVYVNQGIILGTQTRQTGCFQFAI